MSKFGRQPIKFGSVKVSINGATVSYQGSKGSGVYTIPEELNVFEKEGMLLLKPAEGKLKQKTINAVWGLHRALLNNAIIGAEKGFEKQVQIEGLGFKAQAQGDVITFSLGFSHKKLYTIPAGVTIEIDKPGQLLTCRSADKELLGQVCGDIRDLRPQGPYLDKDKKGKGVKYVGEFILRKPGKAKS